MSIIDTHFNFIINKYELHKLYNLFMTSSCISTIIYESVTWCLLYFNINLQNNPTFVRTYTYTIFGLLLGFIFSYRLCLYYQSQLIKSIRIANYKYYTDKLIESDKGTVLNIDIPNYFNLIFNLNRDYEFYINNIKYKNDLPIVYTTLIIRAINTDYSLIIVLGIVYYIYIEYINLNRIKIEENIIKNNSIYESNMEQYFINSKNLIINDEFNNDYYITQINNIEYNLQSINKLEHGIFMKSNISIVLFLFVLIYNRIDKLNQFTFLYYLMLYYDIEYITTRQNEYHKHCTHYNKLSYRIEMLNGLVNDNKTQVKDDKISTKINTIVINKIENKVPLLSLKNKIIINNGEHVLINGVSGSGKSSLLYLLKGIIFVDTVDISPSLDEIYKQTYINLPNYKGIYNGLLYDIISNYNDNPNINLIEDVIVLSKFKISSNIYIDINKISSGELMRLTIARILYSVKNNKNYNILLFDEIDTALNNDLSIELCINLCKLLKDKIIIYITHNEKVKKLFNKVITVNNGNIN